MNSKEKIIEELNDLHVNFYQIHGKRPACVCLDDEPLILEILTTMLEKLGLDVETFTSPSEARLFLQKQGWRTVLIISDYSLTTMNGFEFRKLTHAFSANAYFVISSGFVTQEMMMKSEEIGVDYFLDKPYDELDFLKILRKQLPQKLTSISKICKA